VSALSSLVIQPLSLYWKMIINKSLNTYPSGPQSKPVPRDGATVITTSRGRHGRFELTAQDFRDLVMIKSAGYVNDNIINAFLQVLDQAVRKASPATAAPPRYVFLSTYAASTLQRASNGSPSDTAPLIHLLAKHGVTPANIASVANICFPIHIKGQGGHWVLAIWHPRRAAMTWYDSLGPRGAPRPHFNEISRCLESFWTSWSQSIEPTPNARSWSARAAACPQQKNGIDCGVYTLAACLFRVLGYGRFITGQGKDNQLRHYFAAVLIQGEWGGELPWGWPSPTILPPRHYVEEIVPGSPGY
jgi:Ulp1 family protease